MEKEKVSGMGDDKKRDMRFGNFRYSREAERVFLFYATIGMAVLCACLCLFGD